MSMETDYPPAGTEAERGNGWGGYVHPAKEETQQEAAEPESGGTEAAVDVETAPEAEAEIEAETETEAETVTETEAEAEAEADMEAETDAEAEEQAIPVEIDAESAEDGAQETPVPAAPHAGGDPLLTAEVGSSLMSGWDEIQMSFVENPRGSVQSADALIEEIGTALLASFEERRSDLAAGWQSGEPDTEQLRLALRQYRAFIDVLLPT